MEKLWASTLNFKISDCLIVLVLSQLACSSEQGRLQEGELIENFSPSGGGLLWTCEDGTSLRFTSKESKQGTLCLGIDGSECRSADTPGPGDSQCADPSYNVFLGTCIEEYFSCFSPSGTCSIDDAGTQSWSDGAIQDREYMDFIAAYFPSAANAPCITASVVGSEAIYKKK